MINNNSSRNSIHEEDHMPVIVRLKIKNKSDESDESDESDDEYYDDKIEDVPLNDIRNDEYEHKNSLHGSLSEEVPEYDQDYTEPDYDVPEVRNDEYGEDPNELENYDKIEEPAHINPSQPQEINQQQEDRIDKLVENDETQQTYDTRVVAQNPPEVNQPETNEEPIEQNYNENKLGQPVEQNSQNQPIPLEVNDDVKQELPVEDMTVTQQSSIPVEENIQEEKEEQSLEELLDGHPQTETKPKEPEITVTNSTMEEPISKQEDEALDLAMAEFS